MKSMSRRRGDGNTKLHMDRQPTVARITDPSLPAGKRREIDNVMKKARANNTNEYWDKKLIEAEEKDPNRWRHTGYKKMYIQGESSSGESDHETGNGGSVPPGYRGGPNGPANGPRYGRSRSPRSPRPHSRLRKSPPLSPPVRRRSPHLPPPSMEGRRRSPSSSGIRGRSPDYQNRRLPRPRSPPEPPMRRKSRSPLIRRRSPPPSSHIAVDNRSRRSPAPNNANMQSTKRGQILPRSKRPPSPPPRSCRSRTNSSVSSCSDDSCSVCSPKHGHRSRSNSLSRSRGGPRSPPPKSHSRSMQYRGPSTITTAVGQSNSRHPAPPSRSARPISPPPGRGAVMEKYREAEKGRRVSRDRSIPEVHGKHSRLAARHSPLEDPRLKTRPPEPPEPASSSSSTVAPPKKKKKEKQIRTRIKIEGEKRKKSHSSSDSEDSDSDGSLPTFTATTRLTLSERFGKMAQWSIDRSNMENMRITKDSAGGALKVMIEEGLDSPPHPHPRRYSYSPAPVGHFPEELATTAPSGMLSWDDVRVRYDYYKKRGYLRDLDLKDYVKWEEWWYKYQEWLKQERYYEYWERQQMQRRRRKKLPITQRLN